jgi:hypothetical protein
MFAHSTTFTIREDRWDRATGTLGPAKAQIAAIPGLRLWLVTADSDSGQGVAIAVFEDKTTRDQGLPEIEEVLSAFVETLESPWTVVDSHVLAFADNDWQDLIARS